MVNHHFSPPCVDFLFIFSNHLRSKSKGKQRTKPTNTPEAEAIFSKLLPEKLLSSAQAQQVRLSGVLVSFPSRHAW